MGSNNNIEYICEQCGCKHNGIYSKRFCSTTCAHKFSSEHINHKKTKLAYCIKCGKEMHIFINASNKTCVCEKCKKTNIPIHYCKFCGKEIKTKSIICSNNCKQKLKLIPTLSKYFGFNANYLGTEQAIYEYERIRALLYNLYWVKSLSTGQIIEMYNYPNTGNFTAKVLRKLDIPIKTVSYANTENRF